MADSCGKLDITDDGFLSLMSDDGSTKDDVKLPEGEVRTKINKLFTDEGKDTSKDLLCLHWVSAWLMGCRCDCFDVHGRGSCR